MINFRVKGKEIEKNKEEKKLIKIRRKELIEIRKID